MAGRNGKKTTDTEGGTATLPEQAENNGTQDNERKPLKVLSYLVGADTYVQVSIWQRDGQRRDGTPFVTYDFSLRKRYLDHRDKQWKSLYSFHASEAFAVQAGLAAASNFIAELRAADVPF